MEIQRTGEYKTTKRLFFNAFAAFIWMITGKYDTVYKGSEARKLAKRGIIISIILFVIVALIQITVNPIYHFIVNYSLK